MAPIHGRRMYQVVQDALNDALPTYEANDCAAWRKLPAAPAEKARAASARSFEPDSSQDSSSFWFAGGGAVVSAVSAPSAVTTPMVVSTTPVAPSPTPSR